MSGVFSFTFSSMLVIFTYIIIGYILNKKKIVPENTDRVLSRLENYVFLPALVLNTFSSQCTIDSLKTNYPFLLYSTLALFCAFVISMIISRFFAERGTYQQNIYKYTFVFANFGFVGNALIPLLFPDNASEMLYQYMFFNLPMQVVVYTWGISILIPEKEGKSSPLSKLNNPIVYAILLGIIIGITGTRALIPEFITKALSALAECMSPVAMILTGFVIGGYSLKELFSKKRVYVAAMLRLFIIPTVLLSLLYFAGASGLIMMLALFAYATPMGMNTIVFPAAYGGETKTGASMLMISNLLCLLSIPVMYSLFTLIIK
ncbi:MAG: AEC family transporter [Clostridia bacterium]|nr:AEC family transporter [Clostridia bacterium]